MAKGLSGYIYCTAPAKTRRQNGPFRSKADDHSDGVLIPGLSPGPFSRLQVSPAARGGTRPAPGSASRRTAHDECAGLGTRPQRRRKPKLQRIVHPSQRHRSSTNSRIPADGPGPRRPRPGYLRETSDPTDRRKVFETHDGCSPRHDRILWVDLESFHARNMRPFQPISCW